tara:strand:+ start:123 stop:503 length:381 start_codon:yes stop_codon:yes gene_type:complete
MKIRLGDIECRLSQNRYEIVKWSPNKYYGSEQKMIDDGYERIDYPNGCFGFEKTTHTIDGSCFKNPETCYTIASLKYSVGEGCCDLITVGTRLLDLNKQDRKDFFKVYKIAEKNITKEYRKQHNNY